MIKITLLMLLLTCPTTKLVNLSGKAWNNIDIQNMRIAKKRCGEKFVFSPCLKKFIKVRTQVYRAICGRNDPAIFGDETLPDITQ